MSRASVLVGTNYVPSEEEPFMNERQKAYFRAKLVTWKTDILREARETLEILSKKTPTTPTSPTVPPPKPIAPSSCGRVIASAS